VEAGNEADVARYIDPVGTIRRAAFKFAALTPFQKYLYYRYSYSFTPSQLSFLVACLNRTAQVDGDVVEIGCAYGQTTVFLERHLSATKDARAYVCIDTFEGFTETDRDYEERVRGKSSAAYAQCFADASLKGFQRTLAHNGVTRVTPIKADIKSYSMEAVGTISFCLIDVDLYLPVKAALDKVMGLACPGSIVVVDDCQQHPLWDGALQAYEEFTAEHSLEPQIVEGQFGLIRL
jgi:O-methyltransferase